MVFNNNDYEKLALAAAPIQPSSEGPELDSVLVFLNHLRSDTFNRPLAAASLVFFLFVKFFSIKFSLYFVDLQYIYILNYVVVLIMHACTMYLDNYDQPQQ